MISRQSAFTLIEVLVALAIIATALMAALRAAGQNTQNLETLRTRLLAEWVAENLLAEQRAQKEWPAPGTQHGSQKEGNQEFIWRKEIIATPNRAFRRVDVFISQATDKNHELAHLAGFAVNTADTNP